VNTEYTKTGEFSATDPRRRGVSCEIVIETAKDGVTIERFAAELTALKKTGRELTGLCPLPDHDDRTPSFTVNPEKSVFHCHGCKAGGDMVTLAQLAWKIERPDVAAAELLLYFGYEVPQRPPAWFRKQERQRRTRDAVDEVWMNVLRRRLFKYLILPCLDGIEDKEEHDRELERAWREFRRLVP